MSTVNAEGRRRDVAVIGASAGGIMALQRLLQTLPVDFPGIIALVLHRNPYFESELPQLLGRTNGHTITEPTTGETAERRHIYVAPRDLHMTFNDGKFRTHRGPKEHYTRPAIDPLFTSAVTAYGPRVVGVVLTGGGDDGVDGLIAIKAAGGITIAQDPEEALHPFMPMNAISYDHVDLILPVDEIADALTALATGQSMPGRGLARRNGAMAARGAGVQPKRAPRSDRH
jgi:two-component system chemotaxis response regulator CheB